ncbi:MAG: putative ATPase/Tfp pilus assembly protein PilF [Kiritimatiellia bacterium]|jgi:predicted ATPase/Tfp pilus assembly protein PilF
MTHTGAPDLAPGTQVDRYAVIRRIGQGGMASVYEVKHRLLGTTHALKVLHTRAPDVMQRLIREGQLQAQLDPEFVVPVTDILEFEGAPALLMPLVNGCSLADVLEAYRPTEGEAAALFTRILAGVDAAHSAGVIHRDLKPANVLLEVKRGEVRVRVVDFGLARSEAVDHGQTQVGVFMGTPAYAPPEQHLDVSAADKRSDLWSLGVMLFELLTGRRPFAAGSLPAIMSLVQRGVYDESELPEAFRGVVRGLLEPDPATRTASTSGVRLPSKGVPLHVGGPIADQVQNHVIAREKEIVSPHVDTDETYFEQTRAPPSESQNNLPVERDEFVGRQADLQALADRVSSGAHIVSVFGPGGTGKTRLVLRYAWTHRSDWPGGIWFCDLVHVRSLDGFSRAIGKALGVQLGLSDPLDQLAHAISGRGKCLVVLDNVEQVASVVSDNVSKLVSVAPQAVFVCTTRQVLGLRGEQVLDLDTLQPDDAKQLFLLRAASARRGFTPTEQDLEAVTQLVAMLDHLPLAIELAAARVRVVAPRKLVQRMGNRFRLLASAHGQRGRQATLRATLDWSWDLLCDWERAALAQLSVFDGGLDLEAVEGVVDLDPYEQAPWPMDALQALVDKSLVRAVRDDRFDLLVSMQVYAAEKLDALGLREETERRHGLYYADFGTAEALLSYNVHGGVQALRAAAEELNNLVVGCSRAVDRGRASVAAACFRAVARVVTIQGPLSIALQLSERVLDHCELDLADRALTSFEASRILTQASQPERAHERCSSALEAYTTLGDVVGQGATWAAIGLVETNRGRLHVAEVAYERAMSLLADHPNSLHTGRVLQLRGFLHSDRGEYDDGLSLMLQAVSIHRHVGNRAAEASALGNIGTTYIRMGDMHEAERFYLAALAIDREIGDRHGESVTLGNLANVMHHEGRTEEAATTFLDAVDVMRQFGARKTEATLLGNAGACYVALRRFAEGRRLIQSALAIQREVGDRRYEGITLGNLGDVDAEQGRLEHAYERYSAAVDALEEAGDRHACCHFLVGLARTLGQLLRFDEARLRLQAAQEIAHAIDHQIFRCIVLAAQVEVEHLAGDRQAAQAALVELMVQSAKPGVGTRVSERVAAVRSLLGADSDG